MLLGLCMHIIDPVLGLNFEPQIRKKGAHPNRGNGYNTIKLFNMQYLNCIYGKILYIINNATYKYAIKLLLKIF